LKPHCPALPTCGRRSSSSSSQDLSSAHALARFPFTEFDEIRALCSEIRENCSNYTQQGCRLCVGMCAHKGASASIHPSIEHEAAQCEWFHRLQTLPLLGLSSEKFPRLDTWSSLHVVLCHCCRNKCAPRSLCSFPLARDFQDRLERRLQGAQVPNNLQASLCLCEPTDLQETTAACAARPAYIPSASF